MKKSLSLLIALAMVFGMFASMASAATTEPTTAEKYKWFVDQGILKGTNDGNPRLSDNLTRAEFATIATAVGGLKLISSTSSFSDVKVKDWYFSAIQSVSDAGLVNGIGGGKFGPKLNVTVEQVIKVAAQMAKLTPVDGAVVAGASDWAGPYIKAATDAGLAVPTSYKSNATRAQTIDLSYAVYQAGQVQLLSDVKAVVNPDDTITVTGKVDGKVDGVKVVVGTAAEAAATLNADKTFSFTSAKQSAGAVTVKVNAYAGTTVAKSQEVSVSIDSFKVDSVTVLNARQVAVKFNKAVQEGTSAGGHNYDTTNKDNTYFLLAGNAADKVSLSSDKTTVTLTYGANKIALNTYAQFEVKNGLKAASGKALTGYKEALYLTDTTAPTVSSVEYVGKNAKLTFSEPVQTLGTISINGSTIGTSGSVYYTADSAVVGNETQYNSITVFGLSLGTNNSFYLVGGTDFANLRFDYSTTLNVPSDTVAPTISSVTVEGSTIKVKFSEKISAAGSVYADGKTAVVGKPDGDTATYDVFDWLNNNKFLTLSVKISGYEDLQNNKGSDFTQSVTISVDQVKPTFSSIMNDGNKVILKFSKEIGEAPSTVNVKFTSPASVVRTFDATLSQIGYDADNSGGDLSSSEKSYVVYTLPQTEAGTYVFSLKGFKDTAKPTKNVNDDTTATLTYSSGSGSGVLAAKIITKEGTYNKNGALVAGSADATLGNGQIKVVFSNGGNIDPSALNVSHYLLNGTPLPTGTDLYFQGNQTTVLITLPAGTITASGTREIKVVDVKDVNGNTLNTGNDDNIKGLSFLNENVAPVAQSITLTSDTVLRVGFSEQIKQPSEATKGVEVYINDTKYTGDLSFTYANDALVITAAASNVFNGSQTIKVKFNGSNVQDVKGNTVANSEVTK